MSKCQCTEDSIPIDRLGFYLTLGKDNDDTRPIVNSKAQPRTTTLRVRTTLRSRTLPMCPNRIAEAADIRDSPVRTPPPAHDLLYPKASNARNTVVS